MIERHFTERFEIVKPTYKTDRYGNRVADWATASTASSFGYLEPTSSAENDARALLTTEWLLVYNADADINARDRIRHNGETFEVIGPPAIRQTRRGVSHAEARLRWIEG